MSKLMKIFTFGILISIIIVIIGFISGGSISGVVNIYNNDYLYTKQEAILLDDIITSIEINSSSRNIVVHESDKTYIEYYLNEDKETVIINEENNTYQFTLKESRFNFINIAYGYRSEEVSTINLYLNKTIDYNLKIDSKSSAITISSISNLVNLDVKVSSGLILLDDVKVELETNLNSTSGAVKVNGLNSANLTIKNTSGSVRVYNTTINSNIKVNVTSGVLGLNNVSAINSDLYLTSGSLKITNNQINTNKIKVQSGRVTITDQRNQKDMAFNVRTSSGSINIFEKKYHEKQDDFTNKVITYTIDSKSGSVKINK